MPPHFHLKCLGSPELRSPSGDPVKFRTRKPLALLLYLAVEPRHPHRRDRLADLLWPKGSALEGRHSVATALSVLRGKLGRPGAGDHSRSGPFHLRRSGARPGPARPGRRSGGRIHSVARCRRLPRGFRNRRCAGISDVAGPAARPASSLAARGLHPADGPLSPHWGFPPHRGAGRPAAGTRRSQRRRDPRQDGGPGPGRRPPGCVAIVRTMAAAPERRAGSAALGADRRDGHSAAATGLGADPGGAPCPRSSPIAGKVAVSSVAAIQYQTLYEVWERTMRSQARHALILGDSGHRQEHPGRATGHRGAGSRAPPPPGSSATSSSGTFPTRRSGDWFAGCWTGPRSPAHHPSGWPSLRRWCRTSRRGLPGSLRYRKLRARPPGSVLPRRSTSS